MTWRKLGTTLQVNVGDNAAMTIPSPETDDDMALEWIFRYGVPRKQEHMAAASSLASFVYLFNECTKEEAWRRIKLLRAAYREASS